MNSAGSIVPSDGQSRKLSNLYPSVIDVEQRCYASYPNEAPIGRYLARAGYPVFENEGVRFFNCGAAMYESLIPDLKAAKKSIHIETFILDKGEIWDEIFEILKQKVAEGVGVYGSRRFRLPEGKYAELPQRGASGRHPFNLFCTHQ